MGITGLSHVGLFVRDLDGMVDFYTRVVGLTESHRNEGRNVFLTSDIEREDHEVVLVQGREDQKTLVQQLSFRVCSVEDVLGYYQMFKRLGVTISSTVSHGSGISCYFLDPEGNRLEVFVDVPVAGGRGYAGPLDLEQTAEALVAQVQAGAKVSIG